MQKNQIELNAYMQPADSPLTQEPLPKKQVAWKQGVNQRVQARSITLSKINIRTFVSLGTVVSGTQSCVNGGTIALSSYLSPQTPRAKDINFALCHAAVYLGTSNIAGSQLYPVLGTGVVGSQYAIHGGLDFDGRNTSQGTAFNGTNSIWAGQLVNNSGAAGTFALYTQWKYIFFNAGTSS